MRTNTRRYFDLVKSHREKMLALDAEFAKEQARLDKYKDSVNYAADCQFLQEQKRGRLLGLRQKVDGEVNAICDSMLETYLSTAMIAPSEEQLRLLSTLKMRDKLTADEVREAGNALQRCPAALSVLDEMARKSGVMNGVGQSPGMTSDSVRAGVDALRRNGSYFIDGIDELWGADEKLLPMMDDKTYKRWYLSSKNTFTDEATTLNHFGAVGDVAAFSAAVNGGADGK
ncbi:MAG: hypothetical protein LUC39_05815 [Clostridiales bacterium]|nr:hypothetical protein [Clostridiales bacterium]